MPNCKTKISKAPTIAASIHDLLKGDEIDISNLPKNLERTCTKRGFHFNLLICGRYDLGQEDLVETLFGVKIVPDEKHLEIVEGKSIIQKENFTLTDGPVKLHLEVLTTPNFGLRINEECSYKRIIEETRNRLNDYLKQESQLYRRKDAPDNRIHLCLYMLPPSGLCLHPVDNELINRLTKLTNVIPIIARSDMLTVQEKFNRKEKLSKILKDKRIQTFNLPKGDPDTDDQQWINHLDHLSNQQPYACMYHKPSCDDRFNDGQFVYDADNYKISDTSVLRQAIIAHMCELVDSTHYEHYENFRAKIIEQTHSSRYPGKEIKNMKDEVNMVENCMHIIRDTS